MQFQENSIYRIHERIPVNRSHQSVVSYQLHVIVILSGHSEKGLECEKLFIELGIFCSEYHHTSVMYLAASPYTYQIKRAEYCNQVNVTETNHIISITIEIVVDDNGLMRLT